MGKISWEGIGAGGQVPEPLGQVGNGSLRQRGEQAWDGHLGWVPGAVFLNSFFSNSVQNVFYLQMAYLLEMKEQVPEVPARLCSVALMQRN